MNKETSRATQLLEEVSSAFQKTMIPEDLKELKGFFTGLTQLGTQYVDALPGTLSLEKSALMRQIQHYPELMDHDGFRELLGLTRHAISYRMAQISEAGHDLLTVIDALSLDDTHSEDARSENFSSQGDTAALNTLAEQSEQVSPGDWGSGSDADDLISPG